MLEGFPDEELLESTHTFPCEYRFKVIGSVDDSFVGRVLAAVLAELEEGVEPSFSTKTTAGGRHVSVTIEPEMHSAAHVLAVYGRLRRLEGLVMLM
ncbi:YbeD family protein [Thalassoglobus polymorphus]|uniref:DUF493 domain-containing protein n=1 Tax=Thalassoglobus polymorphus TaxID=2527994 RepID=A0A517QP08_9PLAN|nr:DUF493 domain-containing protein [Thalassoglobus polymorphus]QDT33334.1 hypothetical protein Mal48_25870 [Thalassoglobus polymorphus]